MGSIQLYEGHSDSNVVHSAIPPVSQSSWDAKIYFLLSETCGQRGLVDLKQIFIKGQFYLRVHAEICA